MAWNFECMALRKYYSSPTTYGSSTLLTGAAPFSYPWDTALPFSEQITFLFSIYYDVTGGWSDSETPLAAGTEREGLYSLGRQSGGSCSIYTTVVSGSRVLRIDARNCNSSTQRYLIDLGDEDGVTTGLSQDKWYQIGVSMSNTAINYCVNGSTSPYASVTTNSPGSLQLNYIPTSMRFWLWGPDANLNITTPDNTVPLASSCPPSCVIGAAAISPTYLDFTDDTVRGRIWDDDGNFKNPGMNGSLWFSDTYGTASAEYHPYWFLHNGSPVMHLGYDHDANSRTWGGAEKASGLAHLLGGLKKQYE